MSYVEPPGSGSPSPLAYSTFAQVCRGRRTGVFRTADTNKDNSAIAWNIPPFFSLAGSSSFTVRSVIELSEYHCAEGDFARLKGYESSVGLVTKRRAAERSRVRFPFSNPGTHLREAKTVNDLLKATYDVLEVHRTKLVQRNVLHRDVQAYKEYSVCGMNERHIIKTSPLTVQDILSGKDRRAERCFPTCIVVDYDHVVPLKVAELPQLLQRAGTPIYISRSACIGRVLTDVGDRFVPCMPELSEKARELYIRAHGEARYTHYNDTKPAPHGACPPDFEDIDAPPIFFHRPEHDVESIFWCVVSALLQVRPKGVEDPPEGEHAFEATWAILLSHRIPDRPSIYTDPRHLTLKQTERTWRAQLLGDMKDVGTLLFNMSRQIRPEYALCGDGLRLDHLHEAVQRLILQYLVDHDDIPLDPGCLRSSACGTTVVAVTANRGSAIAAPKRRSYGDRGRSTKRPRAECVSP